jgi:uncharacterized coiled-coil DUF342 family protein
MEQKLQSTDVVKKQERNTRILIAILAVMVVGIGVLIWMIVDLNTKNNDLRQFSSTTLNEKELVKKDLNNLLLDYDELSTSNDSLNSQLEKEKEHIRNLIDELETVKVNNSVEINKYRKELDVLRDIMKSYVYQIDSLNQLNQQLIAENHEVRSDRERIQNEFDVIVDKNDELELVVEMASVIKASNINVAMLKGNGKETDKSKKVEKIKTSFTLVANDVADPGPRDVFVRIIRPDGYVLTSAGKTFEYDESIISYSDKRPIIYENQNLEVAVYYNVESTLIQGTYKVEIYMDGFLIGKQQMLLDK